MALRDADSGILARAWVAAIIAAAAVLSSCGGGTPQAVPTVTSWRAYTSEGGGYSMEVPADWTLSETAGLAGFETDVRANSHNWITVSKGVLAGDLEAKLLRSDTRDQAIIGAVQAHYRSLETRFAEFRSEAPEVGTVASSTAGFGSFACTTKGGFMRKPVELVGSTVIMIGLNNLYVFDAYADAGSTGAMQAAFDRMVNSFKWQD